MKSKFLLLSCSALAAAGPGINPNPNATFDPSTSQGDFGPYIPVRSPASSATGAPSSVDLRVAQAMQLAMSNWMTDTGIVSAFLNIGGNTSDDTIFEAIADGAFKAEVDELNQKSVLDNVIGDDPRVSIANLTLTNGAFQSVVDNLQIMSVQGQAKQNLIDAINIVRCTQILPSIDTYMIVAAQVIGSNAEQRRAVRPTACAAILAQNAGNISTFPNVPGVPGGDPPGAGDGVVTGIPGACTMGSGNLPPFQTTGYVVNATTTSNSSGTTVVLPVSSTTTPNLGLPGNSTNSSTTDASTTAITYSSASWKAVHMSWIMLVVQVFVTLGLSFMI